MTTEYEKTPEEKGYERLLNEAWETLTWPAQALFVWAEELAHLEGINRDFETSFEYYHMTTDNISFVARGLTDRDQELLAEIVRAARTAADSRDPGEGETLVGSFASPKEIHHWHKWTADRIESTLKTENARRHAAQEDARRRAAEDPSTITF
jgi:hypothetical protein